MGYPYVIIAQTACHAFPVTLKMKSNHLWLFLWNLLYHKKSVRNRCVPDRSLQTTPSSKDRRETFQFLEGATWRVKLNQIWMSGVAARSISGWFLPKCGRLKSFKNCDHSASGIDLVDLGLFGSVCQSWCSLSLLLFWNKDTNTCVVKGLEWVAGSVICCDFFPRNIIQAMCVSVCNATNVIMGNRVMNV